MRKIASNKLLCCEGLIDFPVVELDPAGEVVSIRTSDHPDREPLTEFHAGLLVVGLCEELITQIKTGNASLDTLPAQLHPSKGLYLITGIDYRTLRPTAALSIRRLG